MWIVDDYGGNVMIPGYEGVPRKSVEILLTVRNGDFSPARLPKKKLYQGGTRKLLERLLLSIF